MRRRDFHSHEVRSLSPSTEVFDEGAEGVGTAFLALESGTWLRKVAMYLLGTFQKMAKWLVCVDPSAVPSALTGL